MSERDFDVRRTEALSLLFVELKRQSDALSTLWGLCKGWVDGRSQIDGRVMRSHPAVVVLTRESYRNHLWPASSQITSWIDDFAENSFVIHTALAQGSNVASDSAAVTVRFMAAAKPLSLAIRDLTDLMSRIGESAPGP